MLTSNDINLLGVVINDSSNKNIKSVDAKKKINAILHNKSIKTVMNELSTYVENIKGNEKNKSVLIVTMSLLRRNLDCENELSLLISKYKLIGCLYGGLKGFLSGDSEQFGLKIKLNTDFFENKYEYITRITEFYYWELIALFESVKVLSLVDFLKFEQLALKDQSKLVLLNMVTHHLNIKPTDDLITKLLQSDEELNQNIGFAFLTENIARTVDDICEIKRSKKNGLPTTKNIKEVNKIFRTEMSKCCNLLDKCTEKTIAQLLFNYLLVHQMQYPIVFARMLMSDRLQHEFVNQIKGTNKIKTLKDVSFLVNLIYDTPALNDVKKRISKASIYSSVTDLLIDFIERDKGIYGWDENQELYITEICKKLPQKNISALKSYLLKKRKTLMCTRIDELVRFKIYLKDNRKSEIIEGILTIIEKDS